MKRTGGEKTDELLGKKGGGPEGLPHSIIVTPEGIEGEVSVPIAEVPPETIPPKEATEDDEEAGEPARVSGKATRQATDKRKAARPTRRVHRSSSADPSAGSLWRAGADFGTPPKGSGRWVGRRRAKPQRKTTAMKAAGKPKKRATRQRR